MTVLAIAFVVGSISFLHVQNHGDSFPGCIAADAADAADAAAADGHIPHSHHRTVGRDDVVSIQFEIRF